LEVKQSQCEAVTVLTLEGALGIGKGDAELRQRFRDLLDSGARAVVLDLRGVTSVDSAGLGEIVACHKRAAELGARLGVVVDPASRIHDFFQAAQLARVFEMYDDPDQAVTELES